MFCPGNCFVAVAGMISVHHHQFFSTGMGPLKFCLGWPGSAIILISVSYLVGMTGLSHFAQLETIFLIKDSYIKI
jgi:TM2 domain-containing membrane protein YozV